jgi:hypothetical protein
MTKKSRVKSHVRTRPGGGKLVKVKGHARGKNRSKVSSIPHMPSS